MDKMLARNRYALFFIGPALAVFTAFGLVPILYNIYLSFFKTDLMSPSTFYGISNYKNLFQDNFFKMSLRNNLIFVIGVVTAHMFFALAFAYLMSQKPKGARLFQALYFLPSVIYGTAIGLLWKFIYHPQFGLLNTLLGAFGMEGAQRVWLAEKSTVMGALVVVTMWQYIGYHMVIQLAAIKNIPPGIYEASCIDGASRMQQFFLITLPFIKNILRMDMILIVTGSLKTFDLVFVMTSGGPSHSSEVISTYMYTQGFRAMKFGYSSSIAVVLLAVCTLAIVLIGKMFGKESYEY